MKSRPKVDSERLADKNTALLIQIDMYYMMASIKEQLTT
jgi:hypothetical protein